jgi:hypothetical protein
MWAIVSTSSSLAFHTKRCDVEFDGTTLFPEGVVCHVIEDRFECFRGSTQTRQRNVIEV